MSVNLYNKSFLSLFDYNQEEINYLLSIAKRLKLKRHDGIAGDLLKNKCFALLFEKPSTRTRCAFEISIIEEGGYPSYINISDSQFGHKESIEDSAKVLAAFYNGIQFRGYSQNTLLKLFKYSGIPVYNGLTDEDHPTQILADLMTIQEHLPDIPLHKLKVVYIGDTRNNVANAWMYAAAKLGIHYVGYGPRELWPDVTIVDRINSAAKLTGAKIEISDQISSLKHADMIYTDVWVSMGEESLLLNRVNILKDYQVTMDTLAATNNPNVLFMHCLPAFHDSETTLVQKTEERFGVDIREVTDEVFRSRHSLVFKQSENRLHTIKAVLVATQNKNLII